MRLYLLFIDTMKEKKKKEEEEKRWKAKQETERIFSFSMELEELRQVTRSFVLWVELVFVTIIWKDNFLHLDPIRPCVWQVSVSTSVV